MVEATIIEQYLDKMYSMEEKTLEERLNAVEDILINFFAKAIDEKEKDLFFLKT